MTKNLVLIIAVTTISAPSLHLISDVLECSSSGFSNAQLLINYAGFLPMPFLMLGLYTVSARKSAGPV